MEINRILVLIFILTGPFFTGCSENLADLPYAQHVPGLKKLPIDGTWVHNDAIYKIEKGRLFIMLFSNDLLCKSNLDVFSPNDL